MRKILVSAFMIVGITCFICSHLEARNESEFAHVIFEQPASFLAPDGSAIEIPLGAYTVEAADVWIQLIQGERKDAVLLKAKPLTHEETITRPQVRINQETGSEHQLVLLLPDGTGLEAIGTSETVRSRGISSFSLLQSPLSTSKITRPVPSTLGSKSTSNTRLSQTRPTIKIPKPLVAPTFEVTYYPSFKGTRMLEGRITRLPVSAFYKQTIASTTGLELRTRCDGGHDTGMILHIDNNPVKGELAPIPRGIRRKTVLNTQTVLYNDDDPKAGGNKKGSYLCPTCQSTNPQQSVQATVYVFSQHRSTAYCALEKKEPSGWKPLTNPAYRHYGGTLVDVGPLQHNDYLEVQTRELKALPGFQRADYDTHMLLFQPNNSETPLLYRANSPNARDPRIPIPSRSWSKGPNYALIGKTQTHSNTNKGVEVNVDLVRGPLNVDRTSHTFGTSHLLSPGRYYVWLYAKTSSPVGSTTPNSYPASNMGKAPNNGFTCPLSRPKPPSHPFPDQFRGAVNSHAFNFRIIAKQGNKWKQIKRRKILNGQMGAKAGAFNLFLMELDITTPTEIAVEVQNVARGVEFHPQWRVMRNPDASDLTVASFNTLYDNLSPHQGKTRNAANLLASKGTIHPKTGEIQESPDQAPWQWDADIIGLQEHRDGKDDRKEEYFYAAEFANEAMRTGSRSWNYVRGQDEDYINAFATDGRGPLFVSEHLWPGGIATQIFVPKKLLKKAGCRTYDGISEYECSLDGAGQFRATFAIPSRITVPRYGSLTAKGQREPDRPIMVVNLHLRDGSPSWHNRATQLKDLIKKLRTFLKTSPYSFNSEGKPDPHHYQNRIVLLGDFNWSSHHCGEHYWFLRTLREAFEYAVDVSMASNDNDMHDTLGAMGRNGIPQGWESAKTWKKNPAGSNNYPWWMTTYRGKSGKANERSDRYDAVLLVGAGWAYDDPVRDYEVMWDRNGRNPMNGDAKGGIEMSDTGNLVTNGGYRPTYPVKCHIKEIRIGNAIKRICEENLSSPTQSGDPALDSDHLPIRARLRIFTR